MAAASLLGAGLGLTPAAAAAPPAGTPSPASSAGQDAITPVTASTTTVPVPVRGTDGRTHLAYELTVVNESTLPATLTGVTVQDRDGHRTLLKLTGDSLEAHFRPSGSAPAPSPPTSCRRGVRDGSGSMPSYPPAPCSRCGSATRCR
ncbi:MULTISPECIES: hypothetical protein [unclassified Streptomyces]|uniref:hypothetical protein n=1 Tax=unclassified Streptomyces TaxID=2593676 RepID=UPI00115FAB14|nr:MULTISPECIES: hypothetical protein [unclassified Streptomyces]